MSALNRKLSCNWDQSRVCHTFGPRPSTCLSQEELDAKAARQCLEPNATDWWERIGEPLTVIGGWYVEHWRHVQSDGGLIVTSWNGCQQKWRSEPTSQANEYPKNRYNCQLINWCDEQSTLRRCRTSHQSGLLWRKQSSKSKLLAPFILRSAFIDWTYEIIET